jgi:hypothetical protein
MQLRSFGRRQRVVAAFGVLTAIGVIAAAGTRIARASDHQDNPLVELNPAMDMSDVYVFPGSAPDRIALVLNSRPLLTPASTPGASFDPNILYQFKIDNTGDAKEDRVIQVIFKGTGAAQTVEVRGPIAPPVAGAVMNTVAEVAPAVTGAVNQTLGSASGMQVFAGPREDPFFLDLEQFLRILPDRKPSTGPLSEIPDAPSATTFRSASAAVDILKGLNLLSIVVELPTSQLTTGGNAKIGVWGTISR